MVALGRDRDGGHVSVATREDVEGVIGAGAPRRVGGRRLAIVALVLAGAITALVLALSQDREPAVSPYTTEPVRRGDLIATVSATGNLAPTNQVEVGSEVSGIVETVLVDVNEHVTSGQELARLDTSRLVAQLERSRAALHAAQATVAQAAATVRESEARLARLREVSRISGGRVPSATEMESAEAALARAHADEASAHAAVAEARATVSSDETTLEKATIRSPIDGVVLARQVEPGQTVAATFQAPVLFTLAESLTQMELEVDVDEADVGQVREGQDATFTVDAYPDRTYPARLTRLRLGSQTVEGVVSYVAELTVDNEDLTLRPGMTATALVQTAHREDVLLVPNAALRFSPIEAPPTSTSLVGRLVPRPPRSPRTQPRGGAPQVWILEDGAPRAVSITTGLTDGRSTEVTGGPLEEGVEVITEQRREPS